MVYHSTPPWPTAIATLLMVQSWNPFSQEMAGSWNFVCWTLSAEALFYALFPALLGWLDRRSVPAKVGMLASMLTIAVLGHTGSKGLLYAQSGFFSYLPLAVVRIPDFVIGVCVGDLYLQRLKAQQRSIDQKPVRFHRFGLLTWGAAAASVFLLCHAKGWWTTFTAISFTALLWGLAVERSSLSRFLASKPIRIGGQISFGMYLMQLPCKFVVYDQFDKHGIHSPILRFAVDLFVLLLLSAICFYGIEDPARKYLRTAFARLECKHKVHPEGCGIVN